MSPVKPRAKRQESADELLRPVAAAFATGGTFAGAEPLGRGLIHGTWNVRYGAPGTARELVIQRVNTRIFGDPVQLMDNVVRTTEHLRAGLVRESVPDLGRRCLQVVATREGERFHRDPTGGVWRAFDRIRGTVTCERLSGSEQAEAAARAFGSFVRRLADLPPPPLHETLPRFHDFPARLAALGQAECSDRHGRADDVRPELETLTRRSQELQRALDEAGFARLPQRVVHHDCKIENLLFDASGHEALCVIDLDTVMSGNLLSDFGELVRSSTNTGAEDEPDLERVDFDRELYAALARGYRDGLGPLLTDAERRALPLGGPLLTLMNAVRFLTDHLDGDIYFRIEHPDHNLRRARAQLRLATRMLQNQDTLRSPFA